MVYAVSIGLKPCCQLNTRCSSMSNFAFLGCRPIYRLCAATSHRMDATTKTFVTLVSEETAAIHEHEI